MRLERRWLVWAAIVILVVGFVLRFLPGGDPPEDTDSDDR
jgi:hypothetical protein